MAQTPEAKVKTFVRDLMKGWFPDAWHYPCPGGPFGKIGAPDDIWVIGSEGVCLFVAIESKSDVGEPSSPQMRNLQQIKRNGGISAIVYGRDRDKMLKIHAEICRRLRLMGVNV